MESLLKAIELCGGTQASFAKRVTENLPETISDQVTAQQVWNWLNRDKKVPIQYCPTIEKICNGQVRCEQLNNQIDWDYLRKTAGTEVHIVPLGVSAEAGQVCA